MERLMDPVKKHTDYWTRRYQSQGEDTILHCKVVGSPKNRMSVLSDWDHVEPVVEARLVKHGYLLGRHKQTLLDFGCGIGRWYPLLSSIGHGEDRFPYKGIDIVGQAVSISKGKYPEGQFVVYKPADMCPFIPDESVSVIFSSTVLQHVTDSRMLTRITEEFYRMLKPPGLVVLIENIHQVRNLSHIHFRRPRDYEALFGYLKFEAPVCFTIAGQVHAVMFGVL